MSTRLRHLKPSDYRRMPWRNGGGTTTEIAAEPNPAGGADRPFVWRVSIADVADDGPFSAFPGYDRTIMLLAGRGMRLDAGPHGVIDLARPLEPRLFSGDWTVEGRLADGPVKDFNLMVDRELAEGSLEVLKPGGEALEIALARDETAVLHVLDGRAACGTVKAEAADTLILESGSVRLDAERGSTLVLARIGWPG